MCYICEVFGSKFDPKTSQDLTRFPVEDSHLLLAKEVEPVDEASSQLRAAATAKQGGPVTTVLGRFGIKKILAGPTPLDVRCQVY